MKGGVFKKASKGSKGKQQRSAKEEGGEGGSARDVAPLIPLIKRQVWKCDCLVYWMVSCLIGLVG